MLNQTDVVFDVDQLRNVCMEDAELMRELVTALIDDATQQMSALRDAIEHADGTRCARLAHYVKGACANVGAVSMAAVLKQIERCATAGDFNACRDSLGSLTAELLKFSSEAATL
ncbi:MAG: Hpt domain-containing protein [Acidobacteriia bacterium]|nr:Hpt domain-containing protein [Terriglobia bacterium]